MEYDELLKTFGEKLGGIELKPDAAGAVSLEADGMPFTILGLDELRQVVLMGDIGEPPPAEQMEQLYRTLLVANHNFAGTHGATLSINPETDKVSLCLPLRQELLDGESFYTAVEQFVDTLETWKRRVSDFRGGEVETAAPEGEPKTDEAGDASAENGLLSGFLQV